MAILTFFSKTTLVRVIIFVTIYTLGLGVPELILLLVAGRTAYLDVAVLELKVSLCVIKDLGIETHDVGVSPLMLRVAVPALGLLYSVTYPVKTLVLFNIGPDFFVALKTELLL